MEVGHQLEMPFSEEQIRMIEFGSAAIVAWGFLTYNDIFGTEHATKWCFRNIPGSKTKMHLADFHNDMT